jgi:hypothetical protein
MRGWVRLHRKLRGHPFWRERRRYSRAEAWIDLILRAAYHQHDVSQGTRILTVKRGQVLTSQVELACEWSWGREKVHAFLLLLERLQMVAFETSKATDTGYTLITLLNYEQYQSGGDKEDGIESAIGPAIQSSIHPTSIRHPSATPKMEKKVKKGRNSDSSPASAGAAPGPGRDDPEGFDEFWRTYPRRVARKAALVAWAKLAPQNGLVERICAALAKQVDAYRATHDIPRDKWEHFPHPASWLNGHRWEDEDVTPTVPGLPDFDAEE